MNSIRPLLEKVAFAALMAILAAGLTTWAEVRSLRHELDQLRFDLREVQKDNKELWANLGYTWTDMQRRDPKALSKPEETEKPERPGAFPNSFYDSGIMALRVDPRVLAETTAAASAASAATPPPH